MIKTFLVAVGIVVLLMPSGIASAAAAETGAGASQVPDPGAVQLLQDGQVIVLPNSVGSAKTAAAGACPLEQLGDYAHISSSAPRAASAHGWWRNISCKATHAVVTVQLQKKGILGIWSDVVTRGVATVVTGGGAGNRATSRYSCSGSSEKTFRSWVDVDLVGIADLPNKLYTPDRKLACG